MRLVSRSRFTKYITGITGSNLVPRALFPGFFGRPAPKAREKRPGDEVAQVAQARNISIGEHQQFEI